MNAFQAVAAVLAGRQTPIRVFFRNDDGGWADRRLQELANEFVRQELPLDIAVIPEALSEQSIELISEILNASDKIAIHQHGFAHTNHQLSGRSCEFGSDRNYQQQHRDIAAGQKILAAAFSSQLTPIFTPPWNRCTSDTTAALKLLGVEYLSRIAGSDPIASTLPELPVAIDWLKKRKRVRLNTAELIEYICGLLNTDEQVVGVMLHHEHMDQDNRHLLRQFIKVLRESQMVSFHSMMDVAGGQIPHAAASGNRHQHDKNRKV